MASKELGPPQTDELEIGAGLKKNEQPSLSTETEEFATFSRLAKQNDCQNVSTF